jgi:hypothetical protein
MKERNNKNKNPSKTFANPDKHSRKHKAEHWL